ncbi:MAG: FAD-binding oxidoreductase [Actinobacteria bacterium ATB1]|nr:FAD-binding oxidoreductase [Actinobacteria bacterium ATB1]
MQWQARDRRGYAGAVSAKALLSDSYAEDCLWQAQVPAPSSSPTPLPSTVDVLVVGSGYCGLSAAHTIALGGKSVAVCDTERVGFGASTRNGGMVIPELKAGPGTLAESYGDLGRQMFRDVNEAFDLVEKLAEDHDFDYVRTGMLHLAHHASRVRDLRAEAAEYKAEGEDVRLLSKDDLAEEIGSQRFHAAVLHERTGALHPAKFHSVLAERARGAGATLHARTRVTSVERRNGAGFRATTIRGAVDAGDVVVATNAYADGLVPPLERRVLPVGSYIVATEVLEPALAKEVSPRGRMFVDTKNLLFYWRLTPDGRMAFGGRRSLRHPTLEEARDFLYRSMVETHPQLRGIRVDYAWGGDVAMTLDRMPHFGRIDGVLYATGCNGSGVGLNTWMGMKAGEVSLGGAPPAFATLTHRAIPMHRWRSAWLPVAGLWFRLQDRTLLDRQGR